MFGDALLTLPEGVPYRIEADSVFGSIDGQEFDTEGIATSRTDTSPGYADASERISVDLSVRFDVLLPIFATAVGLAAIISSLLRTRER